MPVLFMGPWDSVKETFMGCLITLSGWVYNLIGWLYEIFMSLAGARLLTSDMYNDIANTIYIIIGVAMLFVISYAILQGIIDPDKMGGKSGQNGGEIIRKVLITILGLSLTPVLFNILYQAQYLVMNNDVIGKIIFRSGDPENYIDAQTLEVGKDSEGNSINVTIDSYNPNDYLKELGGTSMATNMWAAFFYSKNPEISPDDIHASWSENWFYSFSSQSNSAWTLGCVGAVAISGIVAFVSGGVGTPLVVASVALCTGAVATSVGAIADELTAEDVTLAAAYKLTASGSEDFTMYNAFVPNIVADSDDDLDDGEGLVSFNFLASFISGVIIVYCFANFCIDMAIRAAKLAYYQIIAPIPMILQILPKFKDTFNNYTKNVFGTYFEVFIRILVVYIIVYIISHLSTLFQGGGLFEELGFVQTGFAYAFLVLGLVIFAKQAPKLISETLGIKSGSLNLGLGKKLADGGLFAAGALAGGAITAGVNNLSSTWSANKAYRSGATGAASRAGRALNSGFRSVGSALAGAGSAAARSARSQFMGPGHKPAMSFRDMRAQAGKSAMEAGNARQNRADYHEQHRDDRFGVMGARVSDLKDSVVAWATGPVDTTYMDNRARLNGDLVGLKGTLENTVANDNTVKAAQRRVDDLARMSADDYAYSAALRKKASNSAASEAFRNGLLARAHGETDEAYQARFEAWLRGAGSAHQSAYDALINSEMEEIRSDNSRADFFSRNDYSVDVNSAEYRQAQADLTAAREEADDALKKAKADGVARKLAEANATGLENDTSRALKEFYSSHQGDLRTYSSSDFNGQKLGDYLSDLGINVGDGSVDMDRFVQRSSSSYQMVLEDGHTITVDNSGATPTYTVRNSTGAVERTFTTTQQMRDYYTSAGGLNNVKVTSSNSGTVTGGAYTASARPGAKSSAHNVKDDAERANDTLKNSAEWRDAHARKRAQQEKNNK